MKNIFVLSNALITDTFLSCADYVFNFKINNVYLLSENHTSNEYHKAGNQVIICDNVDEAIDKSDLIIILNKTGNYKNIPERTVETICNKALKKEKEVIRICLKNDIELSCNIDIAEYKAKPVVINIGIGDTSQQYLYEIMLNKIFRDNAILFKQYFSTITYQILKALSDRGYLCDEIARVLESTNNEYQVIIKAITITKVSELHAISDYISTLYPDYCVLCVGCNKIDESYVKNIFRYKYNCVTSFYESDYIDTQDSSREMIHIKLVQNNNYTQQNKYLNSMKTLEEELFSSLAYPRGVHVLN